MPHRDILDDPEPLKRSLLASVSLHAGVVAAIVGAGWVASGRAEQWGDPKSLGGGTVGITAVSSIPLPRRAGIVNPVANDTESVIPSKPEPKKTVKAPEPDAIAIKGRNTQKNQSDRIASQQKYRPMPERSNQVYSGTGQAAVSPLISPAPGGGGVGSGSQNPFGYGHGAYAALIREKVARNWRREGLDPRLKLPPAIIVFDLQRDGSVSNARILQSSGHYLLDQSGLRAVLQSSPFQPLPRDLPNSSYTISLEFWLNQ